MGMSLLCPAALLQSEAQKLMCMWFVVVQAITLPSPTFPPNTVCLAFFFKLVFCVGGRKLSPCAHRRLSGPQSSADKEGLRSNFKSLSHYFTVTLCDKGYQCTYVTVISFLASNFWLFLLMEDSKWDMSASYCPYLLCLEGMVNCVNTDFNQVRWAYTISSSVDGELDLHGVTAPTPAPRHAAGKPTNCNICCTCEFLAANHQPHIWGYLFNEI